MMNSPEGNEMRQTEEETGNSGDTFEKDFLRDRDADQEGLDTENFGENDMAMPNKDWEQNVIRPIQKSAEDGFDTSIPDAFLRDLERQHGGSIQIDQNPETLG